MVTTFNDRIIYLTKTVVPLVGKPSALNNPLNRDKNAPSIGMKRQAPSAYARPMYQYTPPSRYTSAAEAKRRRLKDELHYTAATVQQALANAGRPPVSILTCRARALPRTVNTDGCMLISSKEYDASDAVAEEMLCADDAHDAQDEQSSVDEMHLYASLIQSTRHFYRLEDSASLTTHNNNNKEDDRGDNDDDDDDDDDDEELRASSDATSTWAPSSTCNNVNLNDKKTIDNDNRSDGTSSNPASSTSEEEETSDLSLSDQCEGDDASPSPPVPEKENCSADGNLIDNKSNSSNDLNNDENHNNDGVEDNYDDLTQVCFVVG